METHQSQRRHRRPSSTSGGFATTSISTTNKKLIIAPAPSLKSKRWLCGFRLLLSAATFSAHRSENVVVVAVLHTKSGTVGDCSSSIKILFCVAVSVESVLYLYVSTVVD